MVGSLNADLVQQVERFPRPGETVVGGDLAIIPGGKGANQAFAAGLLGAGVKMVGQVGHDPFGPMLLKNLQKANVDIAGIEVSETASGTAAILVLSTGENIIIISPGANAKLTPEVVADRLRVIEPGSIVLVQLEIPLATTRLSLETARQRGAVTILDPAPAQDLPSDLLALVDFLTPNQTEAALLLQSNAEIASYEDAEQASRKLLERGPSTVVLKMGQQGVVIATSEGIERVEGFPVNAVDSTAAGDTFNGAFAVGLAEGKSYRDAARFANAAGAISVTRQGAQSSIPTRAEVDDLLAAHQDRR